MKVQCPTCGGAGQVAVEKAGAPEIAATPGGIVPPNVSEEAAAEAPSPSDPRNALRMVTIVVAEKCKNCGGEGWMGGFSPPS